MNNKNKESLADKIAGVLSAAPTSFDPEDDIADSTRAPLVFEDENDELNDKEEEILSKFRKDNIDLLGDVDEKYAGKRASRKSLKDSDEDSSEEDQNKSASEQENDDESESNDEDESEEEDELSEDEGDDHSLLNDEEASNFKHLTDSKAPSQLNKALCVRNQMAMWENLLEIRIQLQKCLITSNKMPQNGDLPAIKQELGPEFATKLAETKQTVGGVLDKLMQLQNLLTNQFPETTQLDSKTPDNDDEEIPSDSEPEEAKEEELPDEIVPKKRRRLEEFALEIGRQHETYTTYRNGVIQKWNDKTRVVARGMGNTHSVLHQIDYNLSAKDKLVKRTQLKRSQYAVVGRDGPKSDDAGQEEEYDSEIFDDDDFYHQLLRELIEVKSADVTDPVQLGRQWIQLQSLRSKMKRKIDTKATKGRKIRYVVHNKLVNFMAPMDRQLWTEEAKTELYNSLFGRTV